MSAVSHWKFSTFNFVYWPTTHGPLRAVTLSALSSALLHWAFVYFERESVIFAVFASQLKESTFHSIVTHEVFFPSTFIGLFVWQQVIKRCLKTNRHTCETEFLQRKERKNRNFYEIKVGKTFCRNLHHRPKKYFKVACRLKLIQLRQQQKKQLPFIILAKNLKPILCRVIKGT